MARFSAVVRRFTAVRLPVSVFSVLAACAALPLLALAPSGPVRAAGQEIDPASEYGSCLQLARKDPRAAIEQAGQWEGLGGGTAARHCRAVASDALGEHEVAAVLMEELATSTRGTAEIKVGLLRQAAQAWSEAGQPERAMGVLDAALKILPRDPDTLEDRAIQRASQGQLWEAVDDLGACLDQRPNQVSALILRAAAWRRLDSLDLAATDMSRAESLEPGNPDVWLESGNLALRQGQRDRAREAWMKVLRAAGQHKAEPAYEAAADVARSNLEALDVNTGAPARR